MQPVSDSELTVGKSYLIEYTDKDRHEHDTSPHIKNNKYSGVLDKIIVHPVYPQKTMYEFRDVQPVDKPIYGIFFQQSQLKPERIYRRKDTGGEEEITRKPRYVLYEPTGMDKRLGAAVSYSLPERGNSVLTDRVLAYIKPGIQKRPIGQPKSKKISSVTVGRGTRKRRV